MAKAFKFPKSMGICADRLYEIRAKRIAEQKKVDLLAEEENALKAHIIENLPKSQQTGASGKKANVKITKKDVPQIEDLSKLYGFIRKTKREDLLQKRLNEGAINEILESGKQVPGIKIFTAIGVSVTKVG